MDLRRRSGPTFGKRRPFPVKLTGAFTHSRGVISAHSRGGISAHSRGGISARSRGGISAHSRGGISALPPTTQVRVSAAGSDPAR
jgi:hypothetical protein